MVNRSIEFNKGGVTYTLNSYGSSTYSPRPG
jgi:hypothetical protein